MSEGIKTGMVLPPTYKTIPAAELNFQSNAEKAKFIPQVGKEFRIGAGDGTYLVYVVSIVNLGQLRFTCKLKEIQTVELANAKKT
jgi:hypothetical protein